MKIHHVLFVGALVFSIAAWADNWEKRNKDDFNIDQPAVEASEPEPAPAPVVPPEEKKPDASKKPADAKKNKTEPAPAPVTPPAETKPTALKSLKSLPAHRLDGTKVAFNKIVFFACSNIPNNRFLFNKKQTDHCWIKNSAEAQVMAKKIGGDHFGQKTIFFDKCPEEMSSEKHCNPKSLRDF